MSHRFARLFVFVAVLCTAAPLSALTFNSVASGNWNSPGTWDDGSLVPGSGDTVNITGGFTVTITGAELANDVTVVNGTLTFSGPSPSLFVTTNFTMNTPGASPNLVSVGTGTLSLASGTLTINGGGAPTNTMQVNTGSIHVGNLAMTSTNKSLDFLGAGILYVGGNMTGQLTFTHSTGSQVILNGSGAQSIAGATFEDLSLQKTGGTATLTGAITINGDLAVFSGNLSDGGNQITGSPLGTLTMNAGTQFDVGVPTSSNGTLFPLFSTYSLTPGSTVVYGANAAQNIEAGPTYANLRIENLGASGSFVKGLSGNTTVNGGLTLDQTGPATVMLETNGFNLSVGGDLAGDGGIYFEGTTTMALSGHNDAIGAASMDPGVTFQYTGSLSPQRVRGSIGYATLRINKTFGTVATVQASIPNVVTLDILSGELSDEGNSITGTGAGSTLSIAAGAALKLGSSVSGTSYPSNFLGGSTLAQTSKVYYRAGVAQTISTAVTYGILVPSTTGPNVSKSVGPGPALNAYGLTVLNNGGVASIDLTGINATFTNDVAGDGNITFSGGGSITLGGSWSNTGAFTAGTSTVTYTGNSVTVGGVVYNHLDLDGANFFTAGGTIIVNGNFSLGGTLQLNANNLDVTGQILFDGTTNSLLGTGTFTANTGSTVFTHSGTSAGINPAVSIQGQRNIVGTFQFTSIALGSLAVVDNQGFLNVSGNVTASSPSSNWTNTNHVAVSGSFMSGGTLNTSAVGNMVNYDGSAQTVKQPQGNAYHDLVLSGTGVKTMPAGLVQVAGDFTIAGSASASLQSALDFDGYVSLEDSSVLDLNGFSVTIAGDFDGSLGGTLMSSSSTITFDGFAAQTITTTAATPFDDVVFSNGSPAVKQLFGPVSASDVTINATASVHGGSSTWSVTGNWNNSGTFNGGTSNVQFTGSLQTISASNFYDLTFGGAGTKTLAGSIDADRNFTINLSTTVDAGSFTHNVGGNWSMSGTFNAQNSQVVFDGAGPQSISPTTFFKLSFNNPFNSANASGNITVDDELNLFANAGFNAGVGTVAIKGNITANGFFNAGTTTVNLNGISPQTWSGVSFTQVKNLNITNPAGLSVTGGGVEATTDLTLNGGNVTVTAPAVFGTANGASLTRLNSSYVLGPLQRYLAASTSYPVGTASGYAPVDVTTLSPGSALQIEAVTGAHPNTTGANVVSRFWNVGTSATASLALRFYYSAVEVTGTEANYVAAKYAAGWSNRGGTVDTIGHHVTTGTVTSFTGAWTVGEAGSLGGATQFVITPSVTTQAAGQFINLTITAKDASNNTDASYSGNHTLVFSGANASSNPTTNPAVSDNTGNPVAFGGNTTINFVNGVSTVSASTNGAMKLFKVETANIAATEGTITTPAPVAITVTPAAASRFVISGSASQTAGTANNLGITAIDPYGNTDTNYTGLKNLTFSGANASTNPVTSPTVSNSGGAPIAFGLATAINFTAGVSSVIGSSNGQMVLYNAENAGITATEGLVTTPTPLAATVSAAAHSKFGFALQSPQAVDASFAGTNTLRAEDAYGNLITGFSAVADPVTLVANGPLSGTVFGLGSGSNNVLNQAGDFSGGIANLTALGMKYTGTTGTGTFTATAGAEAGTSNSITINAGPATALAWLNVNSGNPVAINTAFSVTIESRDSAGNAANVTQNTPILIGLNSGTGTLSGTTTGAINAGTNNVTVSGLLYNTAELIQLFAQVTGGDALTSQSSAPFNVISTSADVQVSVVPSATSVPVGTPVVLTYTILNNGPATANSITFTSTIPPQFTLNSASAPCTGNPNVTCNLGTLANGANTTVTINVTPTQGGTINTAGNITSAADPTPGNDSAAQAITVTGGTTFTVINPNNSGSGSLRQALLDANNPVLCAAPPCTVAFNLSPNAPIVVTGDLPSMTQPVLIDGQTQPGFGGTVPAIQIDGSTGPVTTGIQLGGMGGTLRSVSVTGFVNAVIVGGAGSHTVDGCYIGVTPGNVTAGNTYGLTVNSSSNALGTTIGNVIGGNSSAGVLIQNGASANSVNKSFIGINPLQIAAPNGIGVKIVDASNNFVGIAPFFNVISGNAIAGVYIGGTGGPGVADGNVVNNNRIGTNPGGTAAISQPAGIHIDGNANNNLVGVGGANLISGNDNGIFINGPNAAGNIVRQNFIGTRFDGVTALANNQVGISVNNAADTSIGGPLTSDGNVIGSNGGNGITVLNSTGVDLRSNSFGNNAALAIDLDNDGADTNDAGDVDPTTPPAANNKQNFPVITSATVTGTTLNVAVTVDSAGVPSTQSLLVQVYRADAAGDEGLQLLGQQCLPGNAFSGALTAIGPVTLTAGTDKVLAIATSFTAAGCGASPVNDGTSEFSPSVVVSGVCVPPPATISASGPTTFCAGGSVVLTASTGGPGTTWLWSPGGQTTQSITVTASGSYSVTVTNGCSTVSAPTTVTVNPAPTATITAGSATTFCAGGSVVLTASTAGAGTSWLWSPGGQTTQSITVTAGGSYSVTVTSPSGCSATSAATSVTVHPTPLVSIMGPSSTCSGSPVTLSAPLGFVSYSWTGGTTASTQSITVSPTATTTYNLTVTDGNGCTASTSHTVNVTATPTVTITAPASICPNGTANASVVPQAGATYNWSITGGTITGGLGTDTITFQAGPSGNVVLGITITSGSCSSNGSATVPITGAPAVTITGPTSACPNVAFTLDAGPGFTSYAWSTGATTQQITVTQVVASQTYSVTVQAGAGCVATDTHTVALTAQPTATITAPSNVNANSSNTASVPAGPAGTAYTWSIVGGTITAGLNTPNITFLAGNGGSITLNVTVSSGGCTANGTKNISVGQPPADLSISVSATPNPVAAGGQITYTIEIDNDGPGTANTVVMHDPLPDGVTFVSAAGSGWNCNGGNALVTCDTTTAAPGPLPAIVIVVQAPNAAATLVNNVSVLSATPDPNNAGNRASVTTTVNAPAPTCSTTPPTLIAPGEGASAVTSPVTFTWSAVPGAVRYEVTVRSGDVTAPSLLGSTTSTSLTGSVPSGPITWSVTAFFNGDCRPVTSAEGHFTAGIGSNCGTLTSPQLDSPLGGVTIGTVVQFRWNPVPQAVGYRVWVSVDGAAAQDIGTTDGATQLNALVAPGRIRWFVDAIFGGCPSTRSGDGNFVADACLGHTATTLVAPGNNSVTNASSVEFRWNAVTGASGYRLWASVDGAPHAVLGTTSETSMRRTIARGVVDWYMETLYNGCESFASDHFRFTIQSAQNCGNDRPGLVAPANDSTVDNARVTFSWNGVPNAIGYELYLSLGAGTPTLIETTTGATSATKEVPAGELRWFVRANFDGCPSRDSQDGRFTYRAPSACDQPRPVTSSPADGAQSLVSPINLRWSAVSGATSYTVFISRDGGAFTQLATSTQPRLNGQAVPAGVIDWLVEAALPGCTLRSATSRFTVINPPSSCTTPAQVSVFAPGEVSSNAQYAITWNGAAGATGYLVQEATSAAFDSATTLPPTAEYQAAFSHANNGAAPVTYFYRVRGVNACSTQQSVWSRVIAVTILPAVSLEGAAPSDTPQNITYTINLGPELAGQSFTVSVSQPFLTVTPSQGVVPAGGMTLTVTANTTGLPLGTTLGGVTVNLSTPTANAGTAKTTTTRTSTVSVSVVQPVTPTPRNAPPPDALIIPAVAHATGFNAEFRSDVRLSNTSAQSIRYQMTFTPSGESGLQQGQQTTFAVDPGRTIALDSILQTWFGAANTNATGTLEIRPLTQTTTQTSAAALSGLPNLVSFASSRTFNTTANGTYGQFIPAIPFANFIGQSSSALTLQQIAQSSDYRTNLGFVEGSGQPANLLVSVFGGNGQKVDEFPVTLAGGQHLQMNAFLQSRNLSMSDGRVEVRVTSSTGRVTAYASVLDNRTSDPLLVAPVTVGANGASRYVVAGAADLSNGAANWRTDMRVFNAGTQPVEATLSFHSQNGGEPRTANITIDPGQVRQLDGTLASLFNVTNDGGAIHISTPQSSQLIATARTYNQTTAGTFGQFIAAITPNEAIALGTRPLQILQVEESARFRSNIGLAEVTGQPAEVEITVVPPDSRVSAVIRVPMAGNQFRQLNSMLSSMGLNDTHNARVSVRVVSGSGRVTAYGSVIDMLTNDPTFVPGQ